MQQHMGIFLVSLALIVGFIVYFISTQSNVPKAKKDEVEEDKEPQIGQLNSLYDDEIIAVRKIETSSAEPVDTSKQTAKADESNRAVYVLHVMAKPEKTFKGYELLQALLSQGLRFGEMSIFHRYQQTNGKGPVLFSLTSAVEPGTFDIHNMGRCSSPGLTLFMASSCRSQSDLERFDLMHQTASNLAKELNGECLDKQRRTVTAKVVEQYKQKILCAESIDNSEEISKSGIA